MSADEFREFNAALAEEICDALVIYRRCLAEIERGSFQKTKDLLESSKGLLLLALSLEKYSSKVTVSGDAQGPLVLQPLLRPLLEIMLVLSLVKDQDEIPSDLLQDFSIEAVLSAEARQFLLYWGGESAQSFFSSDE